MGHQFARAALAAALTLVAACGADGAAEEPPPVLDNARQQALTIPDDDAAVDSSGSAGETSAGVVDELPPPDPATFTGGNRVVNVWRRDDPGVDVWGRRTFTNGPILAAVDVGYGEWSDTFSAPDAYTLDVVNAGAGPDGARRATLLNAGPDEHITTVVMAPEFGEETAEAVSVFEAGSDLAPEPPEPGDGVVLVVAPSLRSADDALAQTVGSDAFYVGDGTAECPPQRDWLGDDDVAVLSGTDDVEFEFEPGPLDLSLHLWFSPDECDQPSVLDVPIDVEADAIVTVVIYSPNGDDLAALVLPPVPTSSAGSPNLER